MTKRYPVDDRISIAIPEDWELWGASEDVIFVAAAPEVGRDDIQPHFFISKEEPTDYKSSEDYMIGNVIYLQNCTEGYEEHETLVFAVNGRQVASACYDAPAVDWVLTNKQYFLVVDDAAYVITCKMLPEQVSRWGDEFDSMIRSLQVVQDN